MFVLPDNFVRIQTDLLGERAPAWLEQLPRILETCAERWAFHPESIAAPLTYNYVVRGTRADETPVILKICSPGGEFATQSEALRLFDGRGVIRLLAMDTTDEVMLLEACRPGTMLAAIADENDDMATELAAQVMRDMWCPAPPEHAFPTVAEWGQGFARHRARFDGGTGPLPAKVFDDAEGTYNNLVTSTAEAMLLHGDVHHDNILAAEREPWLAIDPKGVVGEPAYDIANFLRNHLPEPPIGTEIRRNIDRRISIFVEQLTLDRDRIQQWAFASTVLSAIWTVEDHGYGWEETIVIAEHMDALR